MTPKLRVWISHLIILVLTTTVVSCYTTKQKPISFNSLTSANSLSNKNYAQLNNALHFYQSITQNAWPTLSTPKILRPEDRNKIVPLLRERLQHTGDLAIINSQDEIYDPVLVNAVKSFQIRHGLKVDGIIGSSTWRELNITPQQRIKQIQINMQRWAKLDTELGNRYILVNIPDYNMSLYENNQQVLTMKAIVGKPQWQTPQLRSKVSRIVFYPYWHVPNKIVKKDILPKIQENPDYLDEMNIKVIKNNSGKATEISQDDIDWSEEEIDTTQYLFRQDPGEENALGIVKFEFPNPYSVYMHDTSTKNLFNTYPRDLSHGCIRLEKPFALVNYLLKNDSKWNDEKIKNTIDAQKTVFVPVAQPLPIIITYITAWVDDQGKVNFRNDIYKLDQ